MTPPGVEHTSAEPSPGHERQVSKDTQATLNGGGANAAAKDERRTRKRAASDGSEVDVEAHGAKRFRASAETSAAPTTAATTAQMTGLPTAAAPQSVSIFTTAAPAAVDPNHDATPDQPDEVLSDDDDDEVVEAAPAQGRCRCTTATSYDDDDVVPPTCVWTTLEPAAIAYGIIPNYVDDNQTPWRLTVIPLPRGARRTEQRANPWLPSCQWVRLGPAHFPYERDPDWVDDDGGAWHLLLIPPPRRAAAEDKSGDDESSGPELIPFVAAQEELCDCCCCRGCCCCCGGCWCCELATSDDELTTSDDAPSGPELYTWTRLGPAFLGFDRYADVVDSYGVAWRRDLLPPPCTDVSSEEDVSEEEGQASSLSDDGVPVDQRSDADIDDDDMFEDAGTTDGSDAGVEYDDEDELEYAD